MQWATAFPHGLGSRRAKKSSVHLDYIVLQLPQFFGKSSSFLWPRKVFWISKPSWDAQSSCRSLRFRQLILEVLCSLPSKQKKPESCAFQNASWKRDTSFFLALQISLGIPSMALIPVLGVDPRSPFSTSTSVHPASAWFSALLHVVPHSPANITRVGGY